MSNRLFSGFIVLVLSGCAANGGTPPASGAQPAGSTSPLPRGGSPRAPRTTSPRAVARTAPPAPAAEPAPPAPPSPPAAPPSPPAAPPRTASPAPASPPPSAPPAVLTDVEVEVYNNCRDKVEYCVDDGNQLYTFLSSNSLTSHRVRPGAKIRHRKSNNCTDTVYEATASSPKQRATFCK